MLLIDWIFNPPLQEGGDESWVGYPAPYEYGDRPICHIQGHEAYGFQVNFYSEGDLPSVKFKITQGMGGLSRAMNECNRIRETRSKGEVGDAKDE